MARFDFNKDGKKDIFDSMIEYEIYKDVMGEDDSTDNTPTYRKGKANKSEDTAIWILLIVITIVPFIIFLIMGINFLTSACFAMAIIFLLSWLLWPLIYKGSSEADDPDKIWLLIAPALLFITGMIIMSIAGY